MKIRVCLSILFCWSWIQSYAWELIAKPFPFFYDLYSNEIYDVYQDREGLIWIGTTASVACYDGFQLRTFCSDLNHPEILTNNTVRFIADSKSHVWITTVKGITLYDKSTGLTSVLADERLKEAFIDDIKTDETDCIWIAAQGRVFLSNSDGTVIKEYNPFNGTRESALNGLYIDNDQHLWVLAKGGRIFCKRKGSEHFDEMPIFPENGEALMMYQDKNGIYWIGTWGYGLWQFFPEKKNVTECYVKCPLMDHNGVDESCVYGIVQDDFLGYLWILGYNEMHAVQYIPGEGMKKKDITGILDPHKMYTRIMKDRQGNLWVGSYDEGYTIYFDASGVKSYPMQTIKEKLGWDANIVNLVVEQNHVWLSQDRFGVMLYNIRTRQLTMVHDVGLGEATFFAPSQKKDRIWVGSRNGERIFELTHQGMDVHAQYLFTVSDIVKEHGAMLNLKEDKNGDLWILTTNAIVSSRKKHGRWSHIVYPLSATRTMTVDVDGKVWCATNEKLYLCSCDGEEIKVSEIAETLNSQVKGNFITMTTDVQSNIWLATSLGEVVKYSKEDRIWQQVVLNLNSSDGKIQEILGVGSDVWIMTNKKILCYNACKDSVVEYNAGSDNVCVRAFRNKALCSNGDGDIYAGGHNGFVHIVKSNFTNTLCSHFPPTITDVLVNGKSLFSPSKGEGISTFRHVELQPSARNVEIHFSKWDYTLGEETSLQFRLLGAEDEWNNFNENRPYAFYHQLPKGEHTFEIRMMQPNGQWGEAIRLGSIIRLPAWYETDVALAVYILLFLVALYFSYLYLYRKNQRKLRSELTQAKMNYLTGDHQLMKQLLKVIDAHIDDNEFDLDCLASEMNMSKSTLYRRIKMSMDMTPLDFIRNVRLKRACELLKEGNLTISEIAYAVGFSTPKYFTKCFKQEFGITPTNFAHREEKEKEDN